MAADGHTNQDRLRCNVTSPAITHWKKRFVARGLAGLHDEARPGRPRAHDDGAVAELLAKVLHAGSRTAQRTGVCVLPLRRQGFRGVL
ncbi:helix-turn-helix domain-containing protein [Trinickia soli]|uniref:helix-turn-helix domain-containing protein n=1 Tax=Trinickia soli TaxID=380675 RepID=UPI003FA3978E